MPNHLAHQNSPYLLQHAHNPVDWYPWGAEALQKARTEDKPIFLSIGYAACHWCHVMAHESFEDADTAAIMNRYFVNIKVDREARPDLDDIYMQAVVAMTGQGGWPMSVFLTPEGVPFLGGTYFPPVPRDNMPAFRQLLLAVAQAWQQDRQQIVANSRQLLEHLRAQNFPSQPELTLSPETLNPAAAVLAETYDWQHGGWGHAPKFPQPMAIEFLLRRASRQDVFARDIASHALKAMARGGMYDVVGGGFARYSTDDRWRVPHFEKMLYDNAQLALAYLHAYLITQSPLFRRVCEETLAFIRRELTHPQGGFYSSLDADSEGEEGKFYLWSLEEIATALEDAQDVALIAAAYGVSASGNFEGKNILQRASSDEQLAEKFHLPPHSITTRLKGLHARLLAARSKRIRPATDDKILVSWNALALTAFAEAGRYLGKVEYTQTAVQNARFLLANLFEENHLMRSWREGKALHRGYLEDHAGLALALLALYQSDSNPAWFGAAQRLADELIAHFSDPEGGFYDTADDHETLITRPKNLQDHAMPCGNSLAAMALLELAAYTGEGHYRMQAERALRLIQPTAVRYPTAFSHWLCVMDFAIGPVQEVVIVRDAAGDGGLVNRLWSSYRPRLVAAVISGKAASAHPPLVLHRPLLNHQPTAYVCQGFACQQPVHAPQDLVAQLS